MKRTLPKALWFIVLLSACGDRPQSHDQERTVTSSALSSTATLTCRKLTVTAGSIGNDQSAGALATKELSGTQDRWTKYVEFAPATSATCEFALPSGMTASVLSGLSLDVNYRGPTQAQMAWLFEAYNFTTSAWEKVGDNAPASSWVWTSFRTPIGGNPSRFVSGGILKMRYRTALSKDASLLDQWVLTATTGGSSSSSSDAGTTTSSPAPSPSTTSDGSTSSPTPSTSTDGGTASTGLWKPKPGTSWQWQLTGAVDTSFDVAAYDIDLFDTQASTIETLHAAGRKVICYFSAGSHEDWRPDADLFPASVLGNALDGWAGERWLDTRAPAVRDRMKARLDLAVSKKCDAVEPDNVDGYQNNPGFPLTASTQMDFNLFLANEAHARGLSIALKNDLDQVPDLVGAFDFAVNEQCWEYDECDALKPFVAANKAVFQVEYGSTSLASSVCPKANGANIDTLIKNLNLDAQRYSCR